MNMHHPFIYAAMTVASLASCKNQGAREETGATDIRSFLGQWTITDADGGVSWLEVRQEDGFLDADLLWRSGSVLPVADVFLVNQEYLVVTRTSEVVLKRGTDGESLRSHTVTSWMEVRVKGDSLEGCFMQPRRSGMGVDSIAFTGMKLPPLPPPPDLSAVTYGEPVNLFNGKDLTGWTLVNQDQTNGFRATDGVLYNDTVQPAGGTRLRFGNLRTTDVFEDFNLKVEVKIPPGGNSGIYLRGMYEIQVFDSYGMGLDSHNMGAVYSRVTPVVSAERPPDTWQSLDITLCDRHVTVVLNGVRIIDNQPVAGPTGGALQADVLAPGPIYLQGDHGSVSFRNMVLTPIIK